MKNIFLLFALSLMALSACKERALIIPELSVGARRVLVEELTGVRCTNCPDGARLLESLQESFGADNLIVVSIHEAPDFSVPYSGVNGNLYDFRTSKGKEMADFIGPFEGAPCASVSRFLPPNGTSLFVVPHAAWSGLITAEFAKDYSLGLFVKNEYDTISRQLDILVNIAPENTLSGEHRLTVVITQDSIVDVQNDNNVIIQDYVHRHVLRDVITQPSGNDIPEALTGGALISKTFSLKLPATWVAEHCSVVAYVHHSGTPDKVVLQVAEAHVVE